MVVLGDTLLAQPVCYGVLFYLIGGHAEYSDNQVFSCSGISSMKNFW
jgi:hypothetical protein